MRAGSCIVTSFCAWKTRLAQRRVIAQRRPSRRRANAGSLPAPCARPAGPSARKAFNALSEKTLPVSEIPAAGNDQVPREPTSRARTRRSRLRRARSPCAGLKIPKGRFWIGKCESGATSMNDFIVERFGEASLPYKSFSARKSSRGSSKLQLPNEVTKRRCALIRSVAIFHSRQANKPSSKENAAGDPPRPASPRLVPRPTCAPPRERPRRAH